MVSHKGELMNTFIDACIDFDSNLQNLGIKAGKSNIATLQQTLENGIILA